ncbi:MAG TPA: hypothetical protein VKU36_05320 [Candidatus Babeliales bacterium]|nr:hypothetical protein [Candidatus Babeliales bacterium]
MKNLKNIAFSLVILSGIIASSTHATNDPNVEVFNKSKYDVIVKLITDKTHQVQRVPQDHTWQIALPGTTTGVAIVITCNDTRTVNEFEVKPGNKTVYVSWNPEKKPALYPQTGPLMGLLGKYNPNGKTNSGLPLNNNVSSSQIKQIQ